MRTWETTTWFPMLSGQRLITCGRSEPLGDVGGQRVARRVGHRAQLGIRPPLHLGDESPAPLRHGGDHRRRAGEERAHRCDERRRQALHPADLVHQPRVDAVSGAQRLRHRVHHADVHAVAADARGRVAKVHVREVPRAAIEADRAEAAALAALADLLGVEPADAPAAEEIGRVPEGCRLAGAGPAGEEQHAHGASSGEGEGGS